MSGSHELAAAAVLALLAGAVLAGCTGGEDPTDGEVGSEEARERLASALAHLWGGEPGVADRVAVNVTYEASGNASSSRGYMDLFLSAEDGELVVDSTGGIGGSLEAGGAPVVAAQMGRTLLVGEPAEVVGTYNRTAEPPDALQDVEDGPLGEATTTPGAGEANLLGTLDLVESLAEDRELEAAALPFRGRDALEVSTVGGDPDPRVRAVVYVDPLRPALVEARIPPEAVGSTDAVPGAGEVEMRFDYGEDADHRLREPLTRLETLTLRSGRPSLAADPGEEGGLWENRTVQPARETGIVPVEEVTAHVVNRSFEAEGEDLLSLRLEWGSASAREVNLTYEDADGDGAVSTGDRFLLGKRDENVTVALVLEDEATGMRVAPAAGLLPGLAAAGAAALLVADRRR